MENVTVEYPRIKKKKISNSTTTTTCSALTLHSNVLTYRPEVINEFYKKKNRLEIEEIFWDPKEFYNMQKMERSKSLVG